MTSQPKNLDLNRRKGKHNETIYHYIRLRAYPLRYVLCMVRKRSTDYPANRCTERRHKSIQRIARGNELPTTYHYHYLQGETMKTYKVTMANNQVITCVANNEQEARGRAINQALNAIHLSAIDYYQSTIVNNIEIIT